MDDLSRRLGALGGAVAEVSDLQGEGGGSRAAIDAARRSFLAPQPVRRFAPPRARAVALLAAACGAVLAAMVWLWSAPRALSFEVLEQAARPGVVGEWVAAGSQPLALRFSDASTLTLAPAARMRVTTTNPRGADVLIERGAVRAAVTHGAREGRWALRAGPFEVRVTGTVFDASWDPIAETFELTMREGAVVVTGPLLPRDRSVVAGERLRVSVRDGRMDLATGPLVEAPAVSVSPATRQAPAAEPPAPAAGERSRVDAAASSSPRAATPDARSSDRAPTGAPAAPSAAMAPWKTLAVAGKHREALAAAEAAGFEGEVSRGSAADLLLLADVARFAGAPARARAALLAARARLGVRGHTAFLLGRIAADQGGAPGDAVTWFESYLREEPSGAFAEQALGRVVELSRRDPEAASRAAARYLARYPNGAHAALSRRLVAGPTTAP